MGEPSIRARRKGLAIILLPVLAVTTMMALAIGVAYADHSGPHIRIVASGDVGHDLAETPLEIKVGEMAAVDFLIDFPSPADSLYAAEFRWVTTRVGGGSIGFIDPDPDTPTVQVELIGPLADLEQLIVPVIGFPDDPGYVRDCTFDANPPAGSDSVYNFVKGATGDDITVPLMPLDQHNRQEWGDSWCGPTAAGTSLAWFAEMNPGAYGSLVPDSNNNQTLDDDDKYDAINRIGMAMGTSSVDGTTDGGLVDGIATYIRDSGLSSDFSIKVFNFPRYFHYANELMTGDEHRQRLSLQDPLESANDMVQRRVGELRHHGLGLARRYVAKRSHGPALRRPERCDCGGRGRGAERGP